MKRVAQLGIFWIVDGEIVAFKEPASKVKSVNSVKDSDFTHDGLWSEVQRSRSGLEDKEYWQIPRGRVVYREREGEYMAFMPTALTKDSRLLGQLAKVFSLGASRVRAIGDLHYDPPSDELFDD
jgi:hypothetical protein